MQEGIYMIKHPFFFLLHPKLYLRINHKKNKVKAKLRFLGREKPLTCIKISEQELIFNFYIDIVSVDMVIQFYKTDAFHGFFDLPIGQITITGKYLNNPFGE